MTREQFFELPQEQQWEIIMDYGRECYGAGVSDTTSFEWGVGDFSTKETFEDYISCYTVYADGIVGY
jgi:hypothetical protein